MVVAGSADRAPNHPRGIVLLFPGQGAQYTRMAAGLYGAEPIFTEAMDAVFTELGENGAELRSDWLSPEPVVPLEHVSRSQPLLFAIGHGLGQLVLSWGLRPAALLGHSVGEVAAAAVGGVFDLTSATRLIADRVRRLATGPGGGMLVVTASVGQLGPYLRDQVVIGAVNAPRQTVLAGPVRPIGQIASELRAAGITCQRLPSSSPFHSPVLEEAARGAEPLIATLTVAAPSIDLYSAYTVSTVGQAELSKVTHWSRQPVDPVLFWPTLDRLLATDDYLLVEAGPGQGLSRIARRHQAVRSGRSSVAAMLPASPGAPAADRDAVCRAADFLRSNGHLIAPFTWGSAEEPR